MKVKVNIIITRDASSCLSQSLCQVWRWWLQQFTRNRLRGTHTHTHTHTHIDRQTDRQTVIFLKICNKKKREKNKVPRVCFLNYGVNARSTNGDWRRPTTQPTHVTGADQPLSPLTFRKQSTPGGWSAHAWGCPGEPWWSRPGSLAGSRCSLPTGKNGPGEQGSKAHVYTGEQVSVLI